MDKSLIDEILNVANLVDIYLFTSKINRDENIDINNIPDNMVQENYVSVSAELAVSDSSANSQADVAGFLKATVEFCAKFLTENTLDNSQLEHAEIAASFRIVYSLSSIPSDVAINEFLKHQVIHNAWSFWREHAFRMASEANLPKPMIPFFKINAK